MNEHLNIKRNGKGHHALKHNPLTYKAKEKDDVERNVRI